MAKRCFPKSEKVNMEGLIRVKLQKTFGLLYLTFGVEPSIINKGQMPLDWNKSIGQTTLLFKKQIKLCQREQSFIKRTHHRNYEILKQ